MPHIITAAPQQEHQLTRDKSGFHCQVCTMDWKSRPYSKCRGVPVYHAWSAIPPGLHTKTQWKAMQRALLPDASPRSLMIGERDEYNLYREEDTEPMPPKKERKPVNYASRFARRYESKRAAYADACEALFQLNRYAKWEECAPAHRELIYEIKNRLISQLWTEGFCTEAVHICSVPLVGECSRCDGYGIVDSGEECFKCEGTGEYRTWSRPYWAFRFMVDGHSFAWHQPEQNALWAKPVGNGEQHDVEAEEKPVALAASKFAEAKALVAWVLGLNVRDLQAQMQRLKLS